MPAVFLAVRCRVCTVTVGESKLWCQRAEQSQWALWVKYCILKEGWFDSSDFQFQLPSFLSLTVDLPGDWNSICVLTILWSLMSKTFSWIIHACTADLHRKPGSYMYLITCGTSCVDIKWSPLIGLLFAVRLLIELLTWPITFVKLASFAACDWSITNPILCFGQLT